MRTVHRLFAGLLACSAVSAACAQTPDTLKPFITEDATVLVLNNVRLIDGTGAPARDMMRIDIDHGKIVNVQSALLRNAFPPNARVIDMNGKTVFPGLVGMHEHLFYPLPEQGHGRLPLYGEMADSAPRLYLAGGVTSARI